MRYLFGLLLVLLGGERMFAGIVAEIPFEFRDGFLWLEVTSDKRAEPLTFLGQLRAGPAGHVRYPFEGLVQMFVCSARPPPCTGDEHRESPAEGPRRRR